MDKQKGKLPFCWFVAAAAAFVLPHVHCLKNAVKVFILQSYYSSPEHHSYQYYDRYGHP